MNMNRTVGIMESKANLAWYDWQPLVRALSDFHPRTQSIITCTTSLIPDLHHWLDLCITSLLITTVPSIINGPRTWVTVPHALPLRSGKWVDKPGQIDEDHEIIIRPTVLDNCVKRRTCWVGRRPRCHVHPHAGRIERDADGAHHRKARGFKVMTRGGFRPEIHVGLDIVLMSVAVCVSQYPTKPEPTMARYSFGQMAQHSLKTRRFIICLI